MRVVNRIQYGGVFLWATDSQLDAKMIDKQCVNTRNEWRPAD